MQIRSPFAAALLAGALLFGAACSAAGDQASPETSTSTSTSTSTTGSDADVTSTTTDLDETTTEPDDTDGADEDAYVQALTESMSDSIDGGLSFSNEQAGCLAVRYVDIMGADHLRDQGISPDDLRDAEDFDWVDFDLDGDQANSIYDAYGACDVDITSLFLEGIVAGTGLDEETMACVEAVSTEENLRALMVGTILVGEDAMDDIPEVAAFAEALQACED